MLYNEFLKFYLRKKFLGKHNFNPTHTITTTTTKIRNIRIVVILLWSSHSTAFSDTFETFNKRVLVILVVDDGVENCWLVLNNSVFNVCLLSLNGKFKLVQV